MISRARASALLLGSAALGRLALPALAQANAAVRLACLSSDGAAQAFYAKDMGFFAKAGLDADIQAMPNSGAIAAAVVSNSVDIGYMSVDVVAALHTKNIPIVFIAPANEYVYPATVRSAALILPTNSPVRRAKDLNDKVIGVSGLRGIPETATRAWIDQNGGDSSTVKFVEISLSATAAALEAGRFDAAWITEPYLGIARKTCRVLDYGYNAISKHFLQSAWSTTSQWARDHGDLVKRVAAALHEAAIWANKNPADSGEILAKHSKIDREVIATMARSRYADQMTPALVQPLINVSAKYNAFNTFPAKDLIFVSKG
jgi:NitT/TauT family transport system substrate-binding protein